MLRASPLRCAANRRAPRIIACRPKNVVALGYGCAHRYHTTAKAAGKARVANAYQHIITSIVFVATVAFGLLPQGLLSVSRVKTGLATGIRLLYNDERNFIHMYLADAQTPANREECGWAAPAPQLPRLEVFPLSCTVAEFTEKASCRHVIVCHGDHREAVADFCGMAGIQLL